MGKRDMYNASGCKDLTTYYALSNIEAEKRFKEFLKEVYKVSNRYDFRIESRITVADKKTGKILR